jgi:hypothetical protein
LPCLESSAFKFLVFRAAISHDEWQSALDCPTLLVGRVEDHVTLLTRLGRTIKRAEW